MIGKIALWAADKFATRVLRQPKVSRTIRKALNDQQSKENNTWRPAGAPIDFSVEGKKGELRWAGAKVVTGFKAGKLLATDTSKMPGSGTSILMVVVGDRVTVNGVVPNDGECVSGRRTSSFAVNAIGPNVLYPIAKPGDWIYYLIQFDEDCTWEAALYGAVYRGKVSAVPVVDTISANEMPDNPLDE